MLHALRTERGIPAASGELWVFGIRYGAKRSLLGQPRTDLRFTSARRPTGGFPGRPATLAKPWDVSDFRPSLGFSGRSVTCAEQGQPSGFSPAPANRPGVRLWSEDSLRLWPGGWFPGGLSPVFSPGAGPTA